MNAVDTLTPECVYGVVFIVVILWRPALVLSPKYKRLLVAGARDAPPARAGERGAAVAAFAAGNYGRGRGMLSAADAVTKLEHLRVDLLTLSLRGHEVDEASQYRFSFWIATPLRGSR